VADIPVRVQIQEGILRALIGFLKTERRRTGKDCWLREDLYQIAQLGPGFRSVFQNDDFGGTAAQLGVDLTRYVTCSDAGDEGTLGALAMLGRLRPGALGKPLKRRGNLDGDIADHVVPPPHPQPLSNEVRAHILYGNVKKDGNSVGWHHEPSGDPSKGTHVIDGTRSVPDRNGVYVSNVMIEGVKKNARSSFFPENWSAHEVEEAIMSAYMVKEATQLPGIYRGKLPSGLAVTLELRKDGSIITAYPMYEGAP
jgi:hypothetical protein